MNEFIIRLLGNRSGSYFRIDSGIKISISREIINEYTSEIINIYIYIHDDTIQGFKKIGEDSRKKFERLLFESL